MKDNRLEPTEIGEQLGTEGTRNLVSNAEAYCVCEQQQIALSNAPAIVALQAEVGALLDEERDLAERLRQAPPKGDVRTRRRKAVYYGTVAALLTIAAYVFSLYGLEPYRLGLKGYLYCLAIAIVEPFLVDYVLEPWRGRVLSKSLATIACAAGFLSLILLATIRGDRLAEETKSQAPVVVFDDGQPQTAQSTTNFYDKTLPLLQLMMILLAVAMEFGAGLALHEDWRLTAEDKEDWDKTRKRLAQVRARLGELASQITALELAPQVFRARFWCTFYRALFTHAAQSAMTKLLVVVSALIFALHGSASAQARTNTVIAEDLTRSEAIRGPDGKTELQKNIEATTNLLAELPANSRVTIIAITDHSFAQPYVLLSAKISPDPGYFGELLQAARRELVRAWRIRSSKLEAKYRQTDIIGALALAAQIFKEEELPDEHSELVIYSDMRNSTAELNLETASRGSFVNLRPKLVIPNLRNVSVTIRGANGAGKTPSPWESTRDFWTDYLQHAGATVRDYSLLRTQ